LVKKASGAKISSATGGDFTFSILSKKPNTYENYALKLVKVDNKWVLKNKNDQTLNTVDLTPNVDFVQWGGTFSKATFK
jgi:hypothetical protein